MLIIPTEKRLDWNRAPIVLIAIVFLNVAVYFLFQSTDPLKNAEAFSSYYESDNDYYENEYPRYLEFHNLDESEIDQEQDLSLDILTDEAFYAHLKQSMYLELNDENYYAYFELRDHIQELVLSISSIAHGYIPSKFEFTRLFTHMFLHGGIMHLLGNMFFLVLCGFAVEAAIGHMRFLLFYLISGLAAVMAFAVMDLKSNIPLVGASGAISGVMAMYLGVFKLKKIEFFYWFYFFVGYFKAPALLILPLYLGKEVYQHLTLEGSNVAYMAHAGGFVAGAILLVGLGLIFPKAISEEYVDEEDNENDRKEKLEKINARIESYRFTEAQRLIKAYQNEFGADLKLQCLNYNMLTIVQTEKAKSSKLEIAKSLLTGQSLNQLNTESLVRMWTDNTQLLTHLDLESLRKIAWRLCDHKSLLEAEKLAVHIVENNKDASSISLLQKLSKQYAQLNNQPKRMKYAKLAQSINANGVL